MRYDHAGIRYEKLPLSAEKIIAVVGQRCPEALRGAARASGQAPIEQGNLSWSAFAPAAGDIAPLQHISGPDETTIWLTWLSGDEVQRVVHTVGEVAVEVPGGTEHGLISIRHAPKGVRAGVAFTGVRLDLGYSNGHSAIIIRALQDAAEYVGCEIEHLTGKKCPVREMKSVQHIHSNSVSTPRGQVSMAYVRSSVSREGRHDSVELGEAVFSPRQFLGALIRKTLAVITLIVLAGTVSACTATPPTAPATVAPVPSEMAAAAEPDRILIGAETTDVVDENGNVLLSLRYSENGDEAVAAAVNILGEPLTTHHQDSSSHYPEMDGTSWGGFDIVVNRYSSEAMPTGEARWYKPAFSVHATEASTDGGIAVAAVDEIRVGDAFDVAAEGQDTNRVHFDDAFGVRSVALDLPTSFPGIIADVGMEIAYGVIGRSAQGSSFITRIVAPSELFSLT